MDGLHMQSVRTVRSKQLVFPSKTDDTFRDRDTRGDPQMATTPPAASPTVRRRQLGMALERYRKAASLSRDDVAKHIGANQATVSRIEGGRTGVRLITVRALLDLYGIKDEAVRAEIEALTRQAGERGWWSAYASVIKPAYSTYIGFEEGATQVDTYAALALPGLLQTEDYARAVIRAGGPSLTSDEVEQRVQVRTQRQARLGHGLDLWAVLDEAVIRRVVGGAGLMREQLLRLAEASEIPGVTIQIVPLDAGAYPGMVGAFTILRFADSITAPDVVSIEVPTGNVFIEAEDAAWYHAAFNGLRAQGLSPAASVQMIEDAARV
jgi:transcriptional regulator with XRE-family HTH domain